MRLEEKQLIYFHGESRNCVGVCGMEMEYITSSAKMLISFSVYSTTHC
jgi:hypothetical protein